MNQEQFYIIVCSLLQGSVPTILMDHVLMADNHRLSTHGKFNNIHCALYVSKTTRCDTLLSAEIAIHQDNVYHVLSFKDSLLHKINRPAFFTYCMEYGFSRVTYNVWYLYGISGSSFEAICKGLSEEQRQDVLVEMLTE